MSDTLENSHDELERFGQYCSHDLKEPLRIFTNLVQLLLIHNSGNFDETSQEYIQHIFKSVNHMDELISGVWNCKHDRDRKEFNNSFLPHHLTYGSVCGD